MSYADNFCKQLDPDQAQQNIGPGHTFVHSKKKEKEQTNKTVVKIHKKSLIYLLGGETANHVYFMQHMLVPVLAP